MAQQIINIGAAPNDGQGTPLRTSFEYCDENFTELYARAQTEPPPTLVGSAGDVPGMYAYNSTYFYYCFGTYNGSSVIWAQLTNTGNIAATQISSGTSSVAIASPNANVTFTVNGTSNVIVVNSSGANLNGYLNATGNITGGNVSTAGNVSAGYFVGNGSLLTGLPATYGNAQVAAYMPFYTGTLSPIGIYTNNYYYANGTPVSFSGNGGGSYGNAQVADYLPTYTGNLGGTLTTVSQPHITTIGTLTGLTVTGLGAVALNPTANNVSISPTFGGTVTINPAGIGSIDNMNIGVTTPGTGKFSTLSATGNITGAYFVGDGSQLTNLPVGNYSNANVAAYLPTYTGDVTAGNVLVTANVSATGNITGTYFVGNGSLLTGITGSGSNYTNANVAAYLPTYTGNLTAGNISVTGTTTSSVVGNVTGIVTGQLYGLTNGVNTTYGAWDFGYIAANTYTNPLQWIFAQTSAGNIDMGTIASPASYEIDIGTIF